MPIYMPSPNFKVDFVAFILPVPANGALCKYHCLALSSVPKGYPAYNVRSVIAASLFFQILGHARNQLALLCGSYRTALTLHVC